MKHRTGERYAVITGDLVNSSKLESSRRRKAHEVMRAVRRVTCVPPGYCGSLGDRCLRWRQVANSAQPVRLRSRAALFYRVLLLAEAEVDTAWPRHRDGRFHPGNRVSEGDGAAFRLSGRSLEQSGRYRMRFRGGRLPRVRRSLGAMFVLADAPISRRWTARSARAVSGASAAGPKLKSPICGPRPSAPQRSCAAFLRAASWPAMEEAIRTSEKHWGDQQVNGLISVTINLIGL